MRLAGQMLTDTFEPQRIRRLSDRYAAVTFVHAVLHCEGMMEEIHIPRDDRLIFASSTKPVGSRCELVIRALRFDHFSEFSLSEFRYD